MNTAFAQDGLFIYIPDNVKLEKPVQMISIINSPENLLLQNRNLVILGKNSHLTLVMCDDSTNQQRASTIRSRKSSWMRAPAWTITSCRT